MPRRTGRGRQGRVRVPPGTGRRRRRRWCQQASCASDCCFGTSYCGVLCWAETRSKRQGVCDWYSTRIDSPMYRPVSHDMKSEHIATCHVPYRYRSDFDVKTEDVLNLSARNIPGSLDFGGSCRIHPHQFEFRTGGRTPPSSRSSTQRSNRAPDDVALEASWLLERGGGGVRCRCCCWPKE